MSKYRTIRLVGTDTGLILDALAIYHEYHVRQRRYVGNIRDLARRVADGTGFAVPNGNPLDRFDVSDVFPGRRRRHGR